MPLDTNIIQEQSINDINYELLKKQFPNAISIDEDGKYTIDPQKLQMSLDPSKAKIREDGYGLNWVGKKEAYHQAFAKNYKVLKPLNDNNSKNWDSTDNILIKGDNLDALKILRHNYFESIKMIYIDPPYNTQNDGFVYNDNFTTNTKETLEELGYDEDNIEYIENIQGAKTHSGWLSFMYPRLLLARDLLKDDGVIFISIDDNEVAQLRLLCDEVFGGDNFISKLVWEKKTGSSDSKTIAITTEYVLVYTKSSIDFSSVFERNKQSFDVARYKLKDKHFKKRGFYYLDNLDRGGLQYSDSLNFSIESDNGKLIFPNGRDKFENDGWIWKWGKNKVKWGFENDFLEIKESKSKKNGFGVYYKNYMNVDNEDNHIRRSAPMKNLILGVKNSDGSLDIKSLFDTRVFQYTKPVEYMKKIINFVKTKDEIILDFFAGSGTTAHAVMDLNAQDNGNRKFIAVQWAEVTAVKSEAKKAGYDTIFDITQERIKRAGEKIIKDDLTQQDLDIGFRTFEIVEDLKQKIYQKPLEETEQKDLLAFTNTIVESTEDILYNLLVAESLPLSSKIETLIKDKLYKVENVAFILGDITIDELISKLKNKKELEYITVYSPNISDDKFTLECESAVSSIGIKSDKLRFRG